jgi:hypothetical protein
LNQDLPHSLKWKPFVKVLDRLGYAPLPSRGGASRSFANKNRVPNVATFHEPHKKDIIRHGTLREYIGRLNLTKDEFLQLLGSYCEDDEDSGAPLSGEDRYRRATRMDGTVVSVCNTCFETVAMSKIELELDVAELNHPCYSN